MELSLTRRPQVGYSWNDFVLISNPNGRGRPREYSLPRSYLPASSWMAYLDIQNFDFYAHFADETILAALGFSGIGATAGLTMGNAVTLMAYMNSRRSWMSVGNNSVSLLTRCPTLGYNVGSYFKTQIYTDVFILAFGWAVYLQIQWFSAFAQMYVDFFHNSRLVLMYVHHGRILTSQLGDAEGEFKVKLFSKNGIPSANPGGRIKIYNDQGDSQVYNIGAIEDNWLLTLTGGGANPSVSPSTGNFFELDKTWLVEDPALIYETFLTEVDGFVVSKEQKHTQKGIDIQGVWHPDPDNQSLWKLYSDESWPFLPATQEESNRRLESMEKGSAYDGWNMVSNDSTIIRILIDGGGDGNHHNFANGCLVGQYIKQGTNWFEIVGQPRLDTIDVLRRAVNNSRNMLMHRSKIDIYQQKFWIINEIYVRQNVIDTTNTQGVAGTLLGLWTGAVSSISSSGTETTVSWRCNEPVNFDMRSGDTHRNLAQRIRSIVNGGSGSIKVYDKYSGWILVSGRKEFNISNMTVTAGADNPSTGTLLLIKATIPGNARAEISLGNIVSINTGEAYRTPAGFSGIGATDATLQMWQAYDEDGQWALWMDGYISSGFYQLPNNIEEGTKVFLASYSYSLDHFIPGLYWTTRGRMQGVSMTENLPTNMQYVFFPDADNGYITAFRRGNPKWIDSKEQRAVRFGEPIEILDPAYNPNEAWVTSLWFDIPYLNTTPGQYGEIRWLYVPENVFLPNNPFFSSKGTGYGGFNTPATRKFGLDIQTTSSSPVTLPFEYYSPYKGDDVGGGPNASVKCPTYFSCIKANPSEARLSLVDPSKIEALRRGGAITGSGGLSPTKIEYHDIYHVIGKMAINDVFASVENQMTFIYGQTWDAISKAPKGTPQDPFNTPCVFICQSENGGDTWWSPKYGGQHPDSNDSPSIPDREEAALPMLLFYDMVYAGSIFDPLTSNLWVFGYVHSSIGTTTTTYSPSNTTSPSPPTASIAPAIGNSEYQCLIAYKMSVTTFRKSSTIPYYYTKHGKKIGYFRKPTSPDVHFMRGFTPLADNTYNEQCEKIIGGVNSGATILTEAMEKDVISVNKTDDGMRILYKDTELNGIVSIVSKSGWKDWEWESYDNGGLSVRLVFARGGQAPHLFKNFLFYFMGDSLMVKRLDVRPEGSFSNRQELLDNQPSRRVAEDVAPHKIATNVTGDGEVTVHYRTGGGYLSAARSSDGGFSWVPLENW